MNKAVLIGAVLFFLGVHCSTVVDLPLNLQTQNAAWTVEEGLSISGSMPGTNNIATNVFSTTIENQPSFGTNAIRSGSLFYAFPLQIPDSSNAAIIWNVEQSVYIITDAPIARYLVEFSYETRETLPAENLKDVQSFYIIVSAPQSIRDWSIITTSSGDDTLTTDDNWVILQTDAQNSETPIGYTLIYFYQSVTGTERPITVTYIPGDLRFVFIVSVEDPLTTSKLMFFVEFGLTVPSLLSAVDKYEQTFNFPAKLLADIPKVELGSIINFQFVDPIIGVPVPATFTNLCKISSEIRDRSSARHPTKKHYFNQPWFC